MLLAWNLYLTLQNGIFDFKILSVNVVPLFVILFILRYICIQYMYYPSKIDFYFVSVFVLLKVSNNSKLKY